MTPLDHWLEEHSEGLIAIRRNLHAHPELSGEEHATSEFVAERLSLAGLHPRALAVGTGMICDLDGDHSAGERLALRADLDALAMHDEKDVPYRSQVPGVAHACGHDVHTAIVLGTALYFAHHTEELPGPLRFLFQPAEERVPGGALDVIADGGLHDVGAVVGVHCDPKSDVGTVGLRTGPITSAADIAVITLEGPGGHTARPEATVDMVTLAARVVTELPRRVGEAIGDPSAIKLVFGAIRAGDAANVIPTHGTLRASVRAQSLDVWEQLPAIVEDALTELLGDTGALFDLDYTHGVPPLVNDHETIEAIRRAAHACLGADAIHEAVQSWGGDDFAWFARERPSGYIRLGVHDPTEVGPRLDLHAGHFDVDERAIALGVRLLVATAQEYFADRTTREGV